MAHPEYNTTNSRNYVSENLHIEEIRLKTFHNWPIDFIDCKELAMTGMFYTGQADKTKCYFCEVEIYSWQHFDNPVSEHLRLSMTCPLLRRRTTNNITINSIEMNRLLPKLGADTCGLNDSIHRYQMRNCKINYSFYNSSLILLTIFIFIEIYKIF